MARIAERATLAFSCCATCSEAAKSLRPRSIAMAMRCRLIPPIIDLDVCPAARRSSRNRPTASWDDWPSNQARSAARESASGQGDDGNEARAVTDGLIFTERVYAQDVPTAIRKII